MPPCGGSALLGGLLTVIPRVRLALFAACGLATGNGVSHCQVRAGWATNRGLFEQSLPPSLVREQMSGVA